MGVVETWWITLNLTLRILVTSVENPQKFNHDFKHSIKLQDGKLKTFIVGYHVTILSNWAKRPSTGIFVKDWVLLMSRRLSCMPIPLHMANHTSFPLPNWMGVGPPLLWVIFNMKILLSASPKLYMLALTVVATVKKFHMLHAAYGPCYGMGVA